MDKKLFFELGEYDPEIMYCKLLFFEIKVSGKCPLTDPDKSSYYSGHVTTVIAGQVKPIRTTVEQLEPRISTLLASTLAPLSVFKYVL